MKTLLIILLILVTISTSKYEYHFKYRLKNKHKGLSRHFQKLKSKSKTRLNEIQEEIGQAFGDLKSRRLRKVSQTGIYELDEKMAKDIAQACKDKENTSVDAIYLNIAQALSDNISKSVSSTHNVYYVSSSIKSARQCTDNFMKNLGTMFMILPSDYPEDIDFNIETNKIIFIKICTSNRLSYQSGLSKKDDKPQSYALKNCCFDKCSETSQEQDQKQGTISEFTNNGRESQRDIPGDCVFNLDPEGTFYFEMKSLTDRTGKQDLSYAQVQPYSRSGVELGAA